jgi:hypothetical protein
MNLSEEGDEFLAGHIAPPGCYVRVDVPNGRRIVLERPGPLPASLDGSVAVYARLSLIDEGLASPRASHRVSVATID